MCKSDDPDLLGPEDSEVDDISANPTDELRNQQSMQVGEIYFARVDGEQTKLRAQEEQGKRDYPLYLQQ